MISLGKVVDAISHLLYEKRSFEFDKEIIRALAEQFGNTHEEIQELLAVMLSLVQAPKNLEGVLRGRAALIELLVQLLETTSLSSEEQSSARSILNAWFDLIYDSPKKKYQKHVHIEEHPVFVFYIYASGYNYKKPLSEPTPLYKAFCLRFFKGVHKVLSQNAAENTKKDYLRGFRFFFDHTSKEIKSDSIWLEQHKTDEDFYNLIDDAFDNYDRAGGNETGEPTESGARYNREIKFIFFEDRKIKGRRSTSPERDKSDDRSGVGILEGTILFGDVADGKVRIIDPHDEGFPDTASLNQASVSLPDLIPEELEDREPRDSDEAADLDMYFDDRSGPKEEPVPKPPSLRSRWVDMLNLHSFIFFWDSRYLNLYHYSILYDYFERSWQEATDKEKAIIIYLLVLMHTGIEPEKLLRLRYAPKAEKVMKFDLCPIYISVSDGRYCLSKPALIQYSDSYISENNCRTVSNVIKLPVPLFMDKVINSAPVNRKEEGFFFSLESPFKKASINLDSVRAYLAKINMEFGFDLTPQRVSASFFPNYCMKYGLNPVLGCYVSGQSYRIYGSQLHYTYVRADRLEQEYLRVSELFQGEIVQNLKVIKPKRAKGNSKKQFSNTLIAGVRPSYKSVASSAHTNYGYGSAFIPEPGDLRNYISSLKTSIEGKGWDEISKRHNLFVAYCFLGLQFNFAYRRRNFIPYRFNMFARRDVETITDKLSRIYNEARILPVSGTLKALSHAMQANFKKVQRRIGSRINPEMLRFEPELFFFFIDEQGRVESFSLKAFSKYLDEAGLSYPYDLKMPRHFVRTYFFENGVANDLIDAWLGHHHVAREPLGISSALVYQDFIKAGLPVIERLMEEICLTPIPYLPGKDELFWI